MKGICQKEIKPYRQVNNCKFIILLMLLVFLSCNFFQEKKDLTDIIKIDVNENLFFNEKTIHFGQYSEFPKVQFLKIKDDSTLLEKLIVHYKLVSSKDIKRIEELSINSYDIMIEEQYWFKESFWDIYSDMGGGTDVVKKKCSWWDLVSDKNDTIHAGYYPFCNYSSNMSLPRLSKIVVINKNNYLYISIICP